MNQENLLDKMVDLVIGFLFVGVALLIFVVSCIAVLSL